jgi:uncharacterized phage-like protein YoqJ
MYNPTRDKIKSYLVEIIGKLQPDKAISGMALGVDQWAVEVCIDLGLPFTAAIPFEGQEAIWPPASQILYQQLLAQAAEKVVVCPGGYSPEKMLVRDCWMVDRCDKLVSVWDGTSGGTGHTVNYAQKIKREMVRLNPQTWEITGL